MCNGINLPKKAIILNENHRPIQRKKHFLRELRIAQTENAFFSPYNNIRRQLLQPYLPPGETIRQRFQGGNLPVQPKLFNDLTYKGPF